MGKAKVSDSKIVQQLFKSLLKASGSLFVPPECADGKVMETATDARVAEQPERADILKTPRLVVDSEGTIDWSVGQYSVRKVDGADGAAVQRFLVLRATKAEVLLDAEYNISDAWSLRNNHDDMVAQLYRTAAQSYPCRKFFSENTGPFAVKVMKGQDAHWLSLVDAAAKQVASQKKPEVMTKDERDQFAKPTADARKTNTDNARKALKRKAEQLDTRVRRVSIVP